MSQKTQFITRCIAMVENLALTHEAATGLAGVYTARSYGAGATAITDDDMKEAQIDMTAGELRADADRAVPSGALGTDRQVRLRRVRSYSNTLSLIYRYRNEQSPT